MPGELNRNLNKMDAFDNISLPHDANSTPRLRNNRTHEKAYQMLPQFDWAWLACV